MPATPDELFAYLDSLGVAHQTVRHPAVFTVEEARTLRGQIAGGHTKNLFLRDKKGALFLVVAPEDAMIELKSLHRLLGASGRFSFGSAALMRETLGVEPGSVTPFAVINDKAGQVTVILDAAMMAHETLNFHPLVNTATTTIARAGLITVSRSDRPQAADRAGFSGSGLKTALHSPAFSPFNQANREARGPAGPKREGASRPMLQQAQTTAADALVKDTTTQAFVKDVIEESKRQPVLVDFWAPWCGPCKQLTPVLEKSVRAAKGKVKLVKMNIDEHPAIPGQMGIQSIPAVIAFVNGQPADGFMGALPESQVVAFLERLTKDRIGGEAKDLLKAADTALADGDFAGAANLYAQLLAEDNANVHALGGLARSYVETGALDQARQTLAMVPDSKRGESSVAAAQAALQLAEQAKTLGPVAELEQKVAANPLDHQARFELALALNGKARRLDALEQLMSIVRRDRKWNDDGARKQLVQFFDAWGPADEATIEGRKRLSSILFA